MILIILRLLILVAVLIFFVTQIVVPAVRKRKMFPMFNSRRNKAIKDAIELNEEMDRIEIQDESLDKLYKNRNKNYDH